MHAATRDTSDLVACPTCDAIYHAVTPARGERARCGRCGIVLITPRTGAEARIIALALAVLILTFGALYFPFLTIRAAGVSHSASLLSAAIAFTGGPLFALSLVVLGLIVLVPVSRVILLLYVLIPLSLGRPPARGAKQAFTFADQLKPWSMAEIFAIGCAVALVKVADLADITFGPAFWMFALLTLLVVFQDSLVCRWTIWETLDQEGAA
ncbi:paraquat-inducible protein A [Pseudoroseicyclus sp. CXY001]|uniref:paraquat-inducible protein A n=1 Tax=Pseudoroseicyclus sp. CXY001 TaxID=3242492 RepID=UPI00357132AD